MSEISKNVEGLVNTLENFITAVVEDKNDHSIQEHINSGIKTSVRFDLIVQLTDLLEGDKHR